jgi:hypothetical protein
MDPKEVGRESVVCSRGSGLAHLKTATNFWVP